MSRSRSRPLPLVPLGVALALAVVTMTAAACGGDDDAEASGSAGEATGGESTSGATIPPGTKIRVGEQSPVGELSFELAGLNDDLPYEIEYVRFDSGPLVNEGFAAGQIDIGTLGDNPAIGAAVRGLPVTVLAPLDSDGPSIILEASPESGIEELEDLEGKKIAFTTGTAQHGLVLRALDSVGLKQDDVEQIDVPLADLPATLENGTADAAVITYEAEVRYEEAHPGAVALVSAADLPGAGGFTLVLDDALTDPGKRAAIFDYVERRVRSQQWINTHGDVWAEEYYVKERKQTPENAAVVIEGTGTTTFRPIDDELQSALQNLADLLYEAGGLQAKVDTAVLFDPEVTAETNAILDRTPQD
jgi:sulfonate transport system substrate-binding protein